MKITFGMEEDIEAWMQFIEKVRDSFPGMETEQAMLEHRHTVLDFMKHQTAICAKQDGMIVSTLLFSREYNMICFMATAPDCRRQHIATHMYARMLQEADPARRIVVTTYRKGDERGTAARAFYKKQGFTEGKLIEEFGYPSQIMILYQK